jgi:O-antigen ligase/predicted Zn-dependent protease
MTFIQDDSKARRLIRQAVPLYVFVLVLALMPGMQHPAEDVKTLVSAVFAAIFAALWAFDAFKARVSLSLASPLPLILLLFIVIHAIAAVVSDYRTLSITGLRDYVYLFVLFVACSHAYLRPAHAWPLILSIVAAVSCASVYAFAQKMGYDPFPWATEESPEYLGLPATFGNPNYAAHALVIAIVLCGGLCLRKKWRWCTPLAAIMLTHLYLTGYRSALVSLGAAALLLLVAVRFSRGSIPTVRAAILSVTVVALAGVFALSVALLTNRVRTGEFLPLDSSILIRYNAYSSAAKMIASRPILGYGYQAYLLENPKFWTPFEQRWFASERTINRHVHNDALESAIDGGLVASLLYLGLMTSGAVLALSAAIGASRRKSQSPGSNDFLVAWCIATAVAVFAIDGLFGFNLHTPVSSSIYIMLLGVLQGAYLTRDLAVVSDNNRRAKTYRIKGAAVATFTLAIGALILEVRSFRAEQQYHLGISAAAFRQPDRAVEHLSNAERLEPWEGMYPLRLGQTESSARRPTQALAAYNRATQRMPNYLMAHVSVARAALSIIVDEKKQSGATDTIGFLDLTKQSAEKCLALCPVLPSAHEVLGNLYLMEALGARQPAMSNAERMKLWKDAQHHYLEALRYGYADLGEVQKRLAQVAIGLGNDESAERYLNTAVRRSPKDPELWKIYSAFASERKKNESLSKAIGAALATFKDEDKDAAIQLSLLQAETFAQLGKDRVERQAAIRSVLDLAPDRLDVWSMFASLGGSSDPISVLETEIAAITANHKKLGKQTPVDLNRLSEIVSPPNGAWDASADLLQRFCADRSKSLSPQTLARQFAWLGHAVGARAQRMTGDAAKQALAVRNVGLVFAMCKQWPQADHYLAMANASLPEQYKMTNLLQRAEVLSNLERHNEALVIAREAYALEPNSIFTHITLARKLVGAGQMTEARDRYRALLKEPGLNEDQRKAAQQELQQLEERLGVKP